jgi:hypothetical protein
MRVFAFLNVDDPSIAWLVYRGEMVSRRATDEQVLSVWHAKYLLDAAKLRQRITYYNTELEIERVRRRLFPQQVSRLSGLYFFPDMKSARRAGRRWDGNFREEHLAEIQIVGQHELSRYDSEWITQYMNSTDRSWISNYLAGQPFGSDPLWELLIEGRGFVLGTRVRQLAYETVKREWPRSLGLLELSRVAVELGSDLGFAGSILTVHGDTAQLRMYLNFEDAKNPEFLDRLSRYDGPKNTADLNQHTDLVLPDLSKHFVDFKL